MNESGKNQHEWGVIGQSHNPYMGELLYCPCCRKYRDEDGVALTAKEFRVLVSNRRAIGNPVFCPDSDDLLMDVL